VLEAMASRVPVVCSDIALFTDVVEAGVDASVFPVGDEAALAASILALMADRPSAERMAEAGMRMVGERFSVESLRARMVELYDRLLGEGAS
jgi:glycosyltransferase involved in cell wall biosynthesis